MRRWLSVAMSGAVLSMPALAQEARLHPQFKPDEVDHYRIVATIALVQEGDEAVGSRTLEETVDLRVRVAGVHPDGRAVVSVAMERVEAVLTEAPKDGDSTERRFRWAEGDEIGEDPDDFVKVWALAADTVLQCVVDPDGRVGRVEGAEEMGERLDDLEIEGARAMLGVLAPTMAGTTLTKIWGLDPTGGARRPGDVWGLSEQVRVSGSRTAKRETTLTLDSIVGDVAILSGKVRLMPDEGPESSVVDVAMAGEGRAEVAWNIGRGAIDSWEETSEVKLVASLGSEGPRVTTVVNRHLTLTHLSGE